MLKKNDESEYVKTIQKVPRKSMKKIDDRIYNDSDCCRSIWICLDANMGFAGIIASIKGRHPCCYITFPGIERLNGVDDERIQGLHVHGGFTFYGKQPFIDSGSDIWLGWDYAHYNDYIYNKRGVLDPTSGEKAWTMKELIEEIHKVKEQLKGVLRC